MISVIFQYILPLLVITIIYLKIYRFLKVKENLPIAIFLHVFSGKETIKPFPKKEAKARSADSLNCFTRLLLKVIPFLTNVKIIGQLVQSLLYYTEPIKKNISLFFYIFNLLFLFQNVSWLPFSLFCIITEVLDLYDNSGIVTF